MGKNLISLMGYTGNFLIMPDFGRLFSHIPLANRQDYCILNALGLCYHNSFGHGSPMLCEEQGGL
jgi:hypothetical protein